LGKLTVYFVDEKMPAMAKRLFGKWLSDNFCGNALPPLKRWACIYNKRFAVAIAYRFNSKTKFSTKIVRQPKKTPTMAKIIQVS
jgi:hypothetical protein